MSPSRRWCSCIPRFRPTSCRQLGSQPSDDVRRLTSQVFSRTRLERVIDENGLYKDDRNRVIMEEIVQRMRNDIQITAADDPNAGGSKVLKVSFRSTDPRIAQKVTERLTGFIVTDSQIDQVNVTEGTIQFLESQIERHEETASGLRVGARTGDARRVSHRRHRARSPRRQLSFAALEAARRQDCGEPSGSADRRSDEDT